MKFSHKWDRITSDKWVLSVISEGYKIEFTELPQFRGVVETPIPRNREKREALLKEVVALKEKEAITLRDDSPVGAYSTYFVSPKASGKLRSILNLREVNRNIPYRRFRLETLANVLKSGG